MTAILIVAAVLGWTLAAYFGLDLQGERHECRKANQRAWREYQRAQSLERELERAEKQRGWAS